MTEVTATQRIRWEQERNGVTYGAVGPVLDLFTITHDTQRGWPTCILRTSLPSGAAAYTVQVDDHIDALKATAETWLAEFVASLGAVFPDSEG